MHLDRSDTEQRSHAISASTGLAPVKTQPPIQGLLPTPPCQPCSSMQRFPSRSHHRARQSDGGGSSSSSRAQAGLVVAPPSISLKPLPPASSATRTSQTRRLHLKAGSADALSARPPAPPAAFAHVRIPSPSVCTKQFEQSPADAHRSASAQVVDWANFFHSPQRTPSPRRYEDLFQLLASISPKFAVCRPKEYVPITPASLVLTHEYRMSLSCSPCTGSIWGSPQDLSGLLPNTSYSPAPASSRVPAPFGCAEAVSPAPLSGGMLMRHGWQQQQQCSGLQPKDRAAAAGKPQGMRAPPATQHAPDNKQLLPPDRDPAQPGTARGCSKLGNSHRRRWVTDAGATAAPVDLTWRPGTSDASTQKYPAPTLPVIGLQPSPSVSCAAHHHASSHRTRGECLTGTSAAQQPALSWPLPPADDGSAAFRSFSFRRRSLTASTKANSSPSSMSFRRWEQQMQQQQQSTIRTEHSTPLEPGPDAIEGGIQVQPPTLGRRAQAALGPCSSTGGCKGQPTISPAAAPAILQGRLASACRLQRLASRAAAAAVAQQQQQQQPRRGPLLACKTPAVLLSAASSKVSPSPASNGSAPTRRYLTRLRLQPVLQGSPDLAAPSSSKAAPAAAAEPEALRPTSARRNLRALFEGHNM